MSNSKVYIANVEDNGNEYSVVVENAPSNTYAAQKAVEYFRETYGLNVKRNQVRAYKRSMIR